MGINLDQVDMEIITHASQAGPDFEPIADRYPKENSRIQERVKRGVIEEEITAKRLAVTTKGLRKGMVYVNVQEAEQWLASEYYQGDGPRKKSFRPVDDVAIVQAAVSGGPHLEPVRVISMGTAKILEAVRDVANQLAGIKEALESIATQPRHDRNIPPAI